MKLLRLKITDPKGFRSLQSGFEYFFRTSWELQEDKGFAPFVCAGPNGSGKSNLLEVLAAIFFHLECKSLDYRPELFEYDPENVPGGYREEMGMPDGFELEYLSKPFSDFTGQDKSSPLHIKIIKELGGGPQFFLQNDAGFDSALPLESRQIKEVLPEFVLGYSSGENEILSLPFFKMRFIHFDEYLDAVRKQTSYPGTPEGRLTFFDQEFNQAILLSNFILGDEGHLQPFKREMGLEGVRYFRVILRDILYPSGLGISNKSTGQWPILENVRGIQGKLQHCTSAYFYDDATDTHYYDFWLDNASKKAFSLQFGTALELFRAFQLLLTLNLYSVSNQQKLEMYQSPSLYVNETIPRLPSDQRVMRFKDVVLQKTGVEDIVYSKALSDGEHQFLHTLGLCILFRDSQALFLLDEPDTHFNPDLRAKFISGLRECLQEETVSNNNEMLITTHAPFLISDSKPDRVLVFSKTNGAVSISKPEYNTLGASINKITMNTFKKRETIGGHALGILQDLRSRFENGDDKENLITEINRELGDSVEKVLLLKTILDSIEAEG
ncbi:MAG: restriction system-associated AAA family ATPase [Nitrospira sp.]|nr:restriction system-associated AAA family ATPase [Nitrospira sp.]